MPCDSDFFAIRAIRSHRAGPALRYVACNVSESIITTAAARVFADQEDEEGRNKLLQEPEPQTRIKMALQVLADHGEVYRLFPITTSGADEFMRCAKMSGVADEARAHVGLFI